MVNKDDYSNLNTAVGTPQLR